MFWLAATLVPPAILLLEPHDRCLYLPSIAFAVIMAKLFSKMGPKHATGAVIAVGLVFAATTFVEEQYWETDFRIFTRATEVAPELSKGWVLLAGAYADTGNGQQGFEILRSLYSKSPQDALLAYALANAYSSQGDSGQAEKLFRRTLEICGNDRFTRGRTLYELSRIAEKQHNYAEAESLLGQAINITPNAIGFHQSLARVLRMQGKLADAEKELSREHRNLDSKWN